MKYLNLFDRSQFQQLSPQLIMAEQPADYMPIKIYSENKKLTPHKTALTWVVVANGRHAQFYVRDTKPIDLLTPILDFPLEAEPLGFEMGRHVLPRVHQSMGKARHMIEPHLDFKAETRRRFILRLAEKLNSGCEKEKYEQLIIIAPAKVIGELRLMLSDEARKTIIAEVNKDLARAPLEALSLYLKDRFGV